MSEFRPTWLYIKEHTVTGIKYFGKTTRKNPYTYTGSGQYWRAHLAKHGKNITTIWCQLFNDKEELIEYALKFSNENSIVESKEWANLVPENGYQDGGATKSFLGKKHTPETIAKIKAARAKQRPTMLGKKHSEETKAKIRDKRAIQKMDHLIGKPLSKETKEKISKSNKGHSRNKGISKSPAARQNMSTSAKNRKTNPMSGRKHSEEAKQKMREAKRKNKGYAL